MPCLQAPWTLPPELGNELNIAMSYCTWLRHLQRWTRAGTLKSQYDGSESSGHGVAGDGPGLCSWSSILYHGQCGNCHPTRKGWDQGSVLAVVLAGWVTVDWKWDKAVWGRSWSEHIYRWKWNDDLASDGGPWPDMDCVLYTKIKAREQIAQTRLGQWGNSGLEKQ